MIIYDKPGECRMTLDRHPIETIPGKITIELRRGSTVAKFTPTARRHRNAWRWTAGKSGGLLRAHVYSGGDQIFWLGDASEDGGWWIGPREEFQLTW